MTTDNLPEQGSIEELRDFLREHPRVEMAELLLPDVNGILRGKRVGKDELKTLYTDGLKLCASTPLLDVRGEISFDITIGTRDGDPDIMSYPVAGTLAPAPWLDEAAIAQVFISMYELEGKPWFADPRQVLRQVCARLEASGYRPVVATEFEFYLLAAGEDAAPQPQAGRIPGTGLRQDGAQYGSLEDLWEYEPLLKDVRAWCEVQRVPANTALPEFSPGQFEINLHHQDDPLRACDHGVMLKRVIKGAARRHGLGAAFMAKPFAEHSGNGLHVHVSLLDENGRNVFADMAGDRRPAISAELRHAVGGLQRTMAEAMAIFAPNANSYRRLQPSSFVPLTPDWGYNHRAVALRVPICGPEDARVEHRVAGADANPYLVVAAILAGMHYGLTNRCEPTPMIAEKTVLPEQESTLPRYWDAALDRFRDSEILPAYLGEEFCRVYEIVRRSECERFHAQVGSLDYEWYLRGV